MNNKYWVLIMMSFIGLASCSSVPNPQNHNYTNQLTVEAAQHWEVLAQDFAKQAISAMEADPLWVLNREGSSNLLASGSSGASLAAGSSGNFTDNGGVGYIYPSYVEIPSIYLQTNDVSTFGKTFRSYLITEITKLGYPIAHSPEGAVKARWSVNKVYHKADRRASGWPGRVTALTSLGYGVAKVIEKNSSDFASFFAGAVVIDLVNATGENASPGDVPHTEIVLTFTVSKDEKILSRQSQAYYVNVEDFSHYKNIADYGGQESHLKPVNFRVSN